MSHMKSSLNITKACALELIRIALFFQACSLSAGSMPVPPSVRFSAAACYLKRF